MSLSRDTKVAIVTGAARGLGAAISERLSADFDQVVMLDVDEATLSATVDETNTSSGHGRAHAFVCDVRDGRQVREAFDFAEGLGSLSGLVNTAGIGVFSPFPELTEDLWDRTFDVNAKGTFLTCQQFITRAHGPAAIVNIASVAARLGNEMLMHYGASKAAVIEFSHGAARYAARTGIRVNAIMPGFIRTDMWNQIFDSVRDQNPALAEATDDEVFAGFIAELVPLGRPQTALDIAEATAFLLGDRAANITGQTLSVDGGAVMT